MSKHTRGPWHIGHHDPRFVYADGDGYMVADCDRIHHRSIDEMESNAKLIALAPEMYEVAKMIDGLDMCEGYTIPDAELPKLWRALTLAREVIGKLNNLPE